MHLDLLGASSFFFNSAKEESRGVIQVREKAGDEWTFLTSDQLEQVTAKAQEIRDTFERSQYARDRQYPPLGDQLDMIYHAGLGGDEFQAAIKAVKDKYPKP